MAKTIVLIGALDTKGQEFAYVKELIEGEGLETLTVDIGVMGKPAYAPDVTRNEVAAAGGAAVETFADGQHKDTSMQVMATGAAVVVRRLYDEGKLDGVLGMGGGGGTSIATSAMRTLPIGVPKVMLSTLAGGDVSGFVGTKDITMIPSIVDVAGINRISQTMYTRAVGAIVGMVEFETLPIFGEKLLVAASMFGNTTAAVDRARKILEGTGYEVLVFHATGTGGRTMESLIADGYFTAALDMTTTELADCVCGGVLSAGAERCLAASRAGIPAVLVPGCVDMANFNGIETVPEQYRARTLYQWNPNVTLMRTNAEENAQIGAMIAGAANAASAPVAIFLPLRGVSMLDSEGGQFWNPEADKACFDAIKQGVRVGIPVHELDYNINDPQFADAVANTLAEMMGT